MGIGVENFEIMPFNESREENGVVLFNVATPTTTSTKDTVPASNAIRVTPPMNNTKTSNTSVTTIITILHAITIIIVAVTRASSQAQEHSASYTR